MATSLPKLPVEVVEAIASDLNPTDLFSLRLSCKELKRKTLHHFGHTYFTILQTDLSRKSLQKIQSISENEQLRHHVQTLLIKNWADDLGRGFYWHRVEGRDLSGCVDARLSPGVQMLRAILKGMTNCRSFHIYSRGGMEEYYDSEYLLPSDAIGIVLAIIADTGMSIKSFFVDFRNWGSGSVDAKRLQMPRYQQPAFRIAWEKLEELRLEHCLTSDTFDWARDLVLHTTKLKKLSLNFNFDYSTSFLDSLLTSPQTFHCLQEFKLGCAHTAVEDLSSLLLRCHSNLRTLSFWHVYVKSGTWVQILKELRNNFPLLESISVDWPKEYRDEKIIDIQFPMLEDNLIVPGSQGRKFELKYKKWRGRRRAWGASYHGRVGMDKALELLAESVEHT